MNDTAASELREDIPLKSGSKHSSFCFCATNCLEGTKLISVSFFVLSAVITFALLVQIYYGDYQVVPHGSVATDSRECSEIGTTILKEGGNAVDAIIASAFCLAVVNPHITSLDAEGQIMIYNHRKRDLPEVVDFRRSKNSKVAEVLPRMVIGLAYIHQQYGKFAWKDLILPSANLAKQGFFVSKSLATAIKNTNLQNLYGDLQAGEILRLKHLAVTLDQLSDIKEEDLYDYITLENTPIQSTALKSTFSNYFIYVPNSPSIGPELLMNLRHIEHFNFTTLDTHKPEYYYRIAKITQEMYDNLRLNDRFHQGTSSNIAVIDTDDNYISLVTGMFDLFGSKQMSLEGFILDERDNAITTCSRIPIIITDADFICGHRYVLGTNNIVTATHIITSLLLAHVNATTSIEDPRFNLLPNHTIGFEDDHHPLLPDEIIEYLLTLGQPVHIKGPYSSCNIVEKVADYLNSHSDSRGGGISSRF